MARKHISQIGIAGRQTIVYIDDLNLYYGALKGTSYKWLDIEKLCSRLLPGDKIVAVKHFAARVKDTPDNSRAAQRQDVYLRALRTLEPLLFIHYGMIQTQKKRRYLANDRTQSVEVVEHQEKLSIRRNRRMSTWRRTSCGMHPREVMKRLRSYPTTQT